MRRRLIQLNGLDRLVAKERLVAWEYPRPIHEQELVAGSWFGLGSDVIFWLHSDADCAGQEAAVHYWLQPGTPVGPELVVTLLNLLPWIGDLLNLHSILAKAPPRQGELLERFGWTPHGGWWYLSLRG